MSEPTENLEILQRQEDVANRLRRGQTIREIAVDLGISVGQVHADKVAVIERIKKNASRQLMEMLFEELDGSLHLEREMWIAWVASKELQIVETAKVQKRGGKRKKTEASSGEDGEASIGESDESESSPVFASTQQTKTKSPGDPRYAAIIAKCKADRKDVLLRLLLRGEHRSEDGQPVTKIYGGINLTLITNGPDVKNVDPSS